MMFPRMFWCTPARVRASGACLHPRLHQVQVRRFAAAEGWGYGLFETLCAGTDPDGITVPAAVLAVQGVSTDTRRTPVLWAGRSTRCNVRRGRVNKRRRGAMGIRQDQPQPLHERLLGRLSAAGLTGMPATPLPPAYLDHVIAQNKIELPAERHLDRHVCEDRPQHGYSPSSEIRLESCGSSPASPKSR